MKTKFKILLIAMIVILSACGNNIMRDIQVDKHPYVIQDIDRYGDKNLSSYTAQTINQIDMVNYIDEIQFLGKNGEFKIGDTIYIKIYKK